MNKRVSGIYKIINKINGKYYVGSSINICGFSNSRWERHTRDLNENQHKNIHLQRSWNEYGKKSFDFIIVEKCKPDKLKLTEQIYLDKANLEKNMCYNILFSVDDSPCRYDGPKNKMIKKLKLYYKHNKHPMLGKKHNIKTRNKMSQNHADVKGSNNPMYGKHHTKKVCERIRKLNKGKFIGKQSFSYDHTIYQLKNTVTNEMFNGTQYEFNKIHGCGINAVIKKRRKSYKDWILL